MYWYGDTDNIRIQGLWYLPEATDHRVPGIFEFSADRPPRLALSSELVSHTTAEPDERAIILGQAASGHLLTLRGCRETELHITEHGTTVSYEALVAFLGATFATPEAIQFQSMIATLSDWETWALGTRGLEAHWLEHDKYEIDYRRPDPIPLLADPAISIHFYSKLPALPSATITVTESAFVRHEPTSSQSWTEHIRRFDDVRTFMAFAIDSPVGMQDMSGTLGGPPETEGIPSIVHVLQRRLLPIGTRRFPAPSALFVPTRRDDLVELMQAWVGLRSAVPEVVGAHEAVMYIADPEPEFAFLTYFQALEGLHRYAIGGFETEPDEHERRLAEVLEAIPTHRDWLKKKLLWSNEVSARNRLRDLSKRLPQTIETYGSVARVVGEAVDVRNILTHPSPGRLRPERARVERLAQILKLVLGDWCE
ncbi:MAG: hypothetical protein M3256_26835, partial [Actinomycetota bacterium]|nr:hypothetical protein [Actinomycetota bacterium]